MHTFDIEQDLNKEQQAAVLAPDGPVLVIAAAGTGKTRTLTYRVAHLVTQGIPAHRILLLTFTNRAANEMLERARVLVGSGVSNLWGGTFHHMGHRLLRRHAKLLGYGPDYVILDQDDSQRMVKNCVDELKLKSKDFPKASVLQSLFSLAVNKSLSLEELAKGRFSDHQVDLADVFSVHRRYEEKKRALNGMDFDDLLVNALRLFREHEEIRVRYQEQFQHVLVDEYQDTNIIQGAWVDLLAQRHRNLLVVGDDFQSIYSWRGANFRNIITFPERYPDAQVYKLETNYRSTPDILNIANRCIAGNPEQFQKVLRAMRGQHKRPVLVRTTGGYDQARFVMEQIHRLRREGYKGSEIAVLYRAHFHAMELQMEMNRERMAYDITSGVRFFEQAHVKDVCTVVRLAGNPGDELAFQRLLGLLKGVGDKTALKLWVKLGRRFDPWEPEQLALLGKLLPERARENWKRMAGTFSKCIRFDAEGSPGHLLAAFVDAFYGGYAVATFDNYRNRREDLNGLIDFSSKYETLQEFLEEMALQTNLDQESRLTGSVNTEQVVRLSTVHQAKGLEWPVVFVLWMVDGKFPSGKSLDDSGGEAEERRLFYVAVTRAKDELFLGVPQTSRGRDGVVQRCMTSRFVTELPLDMLEVETYR
ncbi:MAG: ATP-dependent helicase [Kiritimatiellae bacterium]|nr:ATP-dependent helicase [Kiritimatiellia bacterium]